MDKVQKTETEPAADAAPTELSSPHFDEIAVAVAQPVEPLPAKRFGPSRLPLQRLAIVIAFGLVLIGVTVATAFLMLPAGQATITEAKATAEQTTPAADSAPAESTSTKGALIDATTDSADTRATTDSNLPRKRDVRSRGEDGIAPVLSRDKGRPVARKVGEIKFGRP